MHYTIMQGNKSSSHDQLKRHGKVFVVIVDLSLILFGSAAGRICALRSISHSEASPQEHFTISPPYIVDIAFGCPIMVLSLQWLPMKGNRTRYTQQQPNKSYDVCTQKYSKFHYINVIKITEFQSGSCKITFDFIDTLLWLVYHLHWLKGRKKTHEKPTNILLVATNKQMIISMLAGAGLLTKCQVRRTHSTRFE